MGERKTLLEEGDIALGGNAPVLVEQVAVLTDTWSRGLNRGTWCNSLPALLGGCRSSAAAAAVGLNCADTRRY